MKLITIVCSIAYFIQFPAQAIQKQVFRQRSTSHPHITLKQEAFHEVFPEESQVLLYSHPQLNAHIKHLWEQIAELERLGTIRDTAAPEQPTSLLQRINVRRHAIPLALTITTAGLTAQHLKDSQLKFEPLSIIASLGALKTAAIGTIFLTLIYLIQKQWSDLVAGKYEERIKRIRLESEYRATAQEMRKHFEKLTENVNENIKMNQDAIKTCRIELLKEIAANKDKLEARFRKYTEENEAQLSKWKADHEAFNKTFEEFTQLLNSTAKEESKNITDSIRRLKKLSKEIAKTPDRLIKKADSERMAQESDFISQQFDAILASKQRLTNTVQHITPPPVSRTRLERFKDLFKHKRSASVASGSVTPGSVTIDLTAAYLGVPEALPSSEDEKK